MTNQASVRILLFGVALCGCVSATSRAGTIVPGLDDASALRTFTTANQTVTNTAGTLPQGVTLAVRLTPSTTDIYNSFTGAVNLLDIGGTQNGSALVVLDGQYWFVSKTNSSTAAAPTSIADREGIDNAVGVAIGTAVANQQADVYASFDGSLSRLIVSLDGNAVQHTLSNVNNSWNWEGNGTLTFAGHDMVLNGTIYGSRGGLSEYAQSRFFTNLASSFTGTASLGQYFNAIASPPNLAVVPEPGALLGLPACALVFGRRRSRSR